MPDQNTVRLSWGAYIILRKDKGTSSPPLPFKVFIEGVGDYPDSENGQVIHGNVSGEASLKLSDLRLSDAQGEYSMVLVTSDQCEFDPPVGLQVRGSDGRIYKVVLRQLPDSEEEVAVFVAVES